MSSARVRRQGGGGKPATEMQPGLLEALNDLVQSAIRGDPEAALVWVSKSQRHLSAALADLGFSAGQKLVGRLLAAVLAVQRESKIEPRLMVERIGGDLFLQLIDRPDRFRLPPARLRAPLRHARRR